jgi:hypothetical protein
MTISLNESSTEGDLVKTMNLAADWFRINDSSWLVWSTSDRAKWKERLYPIVRPGGSLIILQVDRVRWGGYANSEIWDWLKKHRPST